MISNTDFRKNFPVYNQANPPIFFDGPGGTQMCQGALKGMTDYIEGGMANLHGAFATSTETDTLLEHARKRTSELFQCKAYEIAFGQNMTSLAFALSHAIDSFIKEGDEILLSELDHHANIDPWLRLAKRRGAIVKWIPVNTQTCTLEIADLSTLITPKTKLVAIGYASNVCGTINPLIEIIKEAKKVNAVVVVDAVHAAPHLRINFKALDCTILLASAYKFFGPHLGIALIKADLFTRLKPDKLQPAPTEIPHCLETGTQNHEALAGLVGAIDFIESLGEGQTTNARFDNAFENIESHEQQLAATLLVYLTKQARISIYRPPNSPCTATIAFIITGVHANSAARYFAEQNINLADGHFYASTFAQKANLLEQGSWLRIGFAPYNTLRDVAFFIEKMTDYLATH